MKVGESHIPERRGMETGAGNFGIYLQDRRDRKGFTQRELAARLEISPQYLCDIEKGNRKVTDAVLNHVIVLLGLDSYEACWIAGRLPGDVEELLLEAGPDEWRRLKAKYGRGAGDSSNRPEVSGPTGEGA